MKKKIIFGGSALLVFSLMLAGMSLTIPVSSGDFITGYSTGKISFAGPSLPRIEKNFTCASGFPPCSSDTLGICQPPPQPYLKMDNNQYSFTFSAPKAANYTCAITATASYFDYQGTQQPNEKIDVYLNNKKVGTTSDNWCPPGGVPVGEPDCTYSDKLDITACYRPENYEDMPACNSQTNCAFMYGDYGCGGAGCCTGINNQAHCEKRLCSWAGATCKPLKTEAGGAASWGQSCESITNPADCNDYSKHPGIVCCYYNGKCQTDTCPVWYSSRVSGRADAQACCEGNAAGCVDHYKLEPAGACVWDSGHANDDFPCRCANSLTNPYNYIRGGTPIGEKKACSQACSADTGCKSGHCNGQNKCADAHGETCDPAQNWCNDDCTRNCMASCSYNDQCLSSSCQGEKCKDCCGDGVCGPGPSGNTHEYSTTAKYCKDDCCGDGICYILESQNNLCKKDCCMVTCHSQTTKSACDNYYPNICKCVWDEYLFYGVCLDCGEICDGFDGNHNGCQNAKDNSGNTICTWILASNNCECTGY